MSTDVNMDLPEDPPNDGETGTEGAVPEGSKEMEESKGEEDVVMEDVEVEKAVGQEEEEKGNDEEMKEEEAKEVDNEEDGKGSDEENGEKMNEAENTEEEKESGEQEGKEEANKEEEETTNKEGKKNLKKGGKKKKKKKKDEGNYLEDPKDIFFYKTLEAIANGLDIAITNVGFFKNINVIIPYVSKGLSDRTQKVMKCTLIDVAVVIDILSAAFKSDQFKKSMVDDFVSRNKGVKKGNFEAPKGLFRFWYMCGEVPFEEEKQIEGQSFLKEGNDLSKLKQFCTKQEVKEPVNLDFLKREEKKQDFTEEAYKMETSKKDTNESLNVKNYEKYVHILKCQVHMGFKSFFLPYAISKDEKEKYFLSHITGPKINHRKIDMKAYLYDDEDPNGGMIGYLMNSKVMGIQKFDNSVMVSTPYEMCNDGEEATDTFYSDENAKIKCHFESADDGLLEKSGLYAKAVSNDEIQKCYECITVSSPFQRIYSIYFYNSNSQYFF